jgi:hypothetical protein
MQSEQLARSIARFDDAQEGFGTKMENLTKERQLDSPERYCCNNDSAILLEGLGQVPCTSIHHVQQMKSVGFR